MKGAVVITLICALGVAGCGNVTGPSARVVAERLSSRSEPPERTVRWLKRWGYKKVERVRFGDAMFPRTGPCYQRKKGTRIGGQPLVRVCFAAWRHPVVLERNTRDHYWIEHYPNDQSVYAGDHPGLGRISKETQEILKQ